MAFVRTHGISILGAAIALCAAQSASAAEPPYAAFSHVWASSADGVGNNVRPQLTDAAKKIYAKQKADSESGDPKRDPTLRCFPTGFSRMMNRGLPTAIVASPSVVALVGEGGGRPRLVYMNAKHDPEMWPTFMGESVGHWEGETLVVDTVKIISTAWLDTDGLPHSDALHVTERFHLENGGKTLVDDMLYEDPKFFVKPWNVHLSFVRSDDQHPIENVCEDNLRVRP